jgi:hypothetical protein
MAVVEKLRKFVGRIEQPWTACLGLFAGYAAVPVFHYGV